MAQTLTNMHELAFTATFKKTYKKLPKDIQKQFDTKCILFTENPYHPSLRFKRIQGTRTLWELSVTMNYQVTLEITETHVIFRKIGSHDILHTP